MSLFFDSRTGYAGRWWRFICGLFLVLIGYGAAADDAGSAASAHAATITLLHYNDLHAHLTPHADLVAANGGTAVVERGGIARLATLIKKIRAERPDAILMNIGDTYHGGVEALFTLGNAIVDPVNALGIDICVPGNWDFAYGPLVTRLRYAELSGLERTMLSAASGVVMGGEAIKRPNFPCLAANVSYDAPFFKAGKPFLPATWETERDGVKIGFIGISSDIVPRMSATLTKGLRFIDGEANYRALIERHARALRQRGAQLVLVMSELGIHKDHRLAQSIAPGSVDVFFSAHTHEATFAPLTSASGALVVEAGNDGYLGRMDVTVTPGARPHFDWTLLPLDRTIAEDPQMKALVDAARAPFLRDHPNIKLPMPYVDVTLVEPITRIVGYSKGALDRRHALDNTFNRAFGRALRQRAGTDLAITPGFRFDAVIAAPEDNTVADGAITLEDVYRFFPVVYTLGTGEISGNHLREVMERSLASVYSADAFAQSGGWVDGFAGVRAELDTLAADGHRISSAHLEESGDLVDEGSSYRITGCMRPDDAADVLCSYPGFVKVRPWINPSTRAPWTVSEFFIETLKEPLPAAGEALLLDRSGVPVWPQAPFVQPLPSRREVN